MILYRTQKSAGVTSGELAIITLIIYRKGAERYQKKYSQNHFLTILFVRVSSLWLKEGIKVIKILFK